MSAAADLGLDPTADGHVSSLSLVSNLRLSVPPAAAKSGANRQVGNTEWLRGGARSENRPRVIA